MEITDRLRERTAMRRRYFLPLIVALTGTALTLGTVSCDSKREPKTDLSPEVTQLVRKYEEMKLAGLHNQKSKFMHMRDSVTRQEVGAYFNRTGRVIDSAKIFQWAFNWPDVAGLPLVEDSINGRWRRLIFRQCGLMDADSIEDCIFSVVLFGKDGDDWNISNACKIGQHHYKSDGSEIGVEDLVFNDLFQLPPSFEPLYRQQKTGDSTAKPPTLMPVDPSTLKPGAKPEGSR